jgi:hypothetical protein
LWISICRIIRINFASIFILKINWKVNL